MLFLSFKIKESGCHINLCSQIRILAIPDKGNFPLGSPKNQKKAQISDFCQHGLQRQKDVSIHGQNKDSFREREQNGQSKAEMEI